MLAVSPAGVRGLIALRYATLVSDGVLQGEFTLGWRTAMRVLARGIRVGRAWTSMKPCSKENV